MHINASCTLAFLTAHSVQVTKYDLEVVAALNDPQDSMMSDA